VLANKREFTLVKRTDGFCIQFFAMASQCEAIIETTKKSLAKKLAKVISEEVWRIQDKYSRYDPKSVCSKINNSQGKAITIDEETYLLLNFADTCFQLSDGLFDITSGVLRKIWKFDCSNNIPTQTQINTLLPLIGWQKVIFDQDKISLPENMELDLGGIGKEYAVDRCIIIAKQLTDKPVLINLGGDLAVTSARKNNQAWHVGVENPGHAEKKPMIVSLRKGAIATSGDAKRYLLKEGVRYSHILNAKTGSPIENAPRSITVAAPQCIQAGILATLSSMQGKEAEQFLEEQEIKFWAIR
jgi:thiamine biosynthesis lipoprotein